MNKISNDSISIDLLYIDNLLYEHIFEYYNEITRILDGVNYDGILSIRNEIYDGINLFDKEFISRDDLNEILKAKTKLENAFTECSNMLLQLAMQSINDESIFYLDEIVKKYHSKK